MTTPKISLLDEHTINQIAAGEVIEQPASVVKELVENALDAGAENISIDIFLGGRQNIRIVDDGLGMDPQDAELCLQRYATSKLRQVDDLFSLETLGFRGEAIPSIAAISKFSLLTKKKEAHKGTLICVEGGKLLKKEAVPCEAGTTIEVKELFFNVPARKKFQKSPTSDFNEIFKVISSFSLGHVDKNFCLKHDGQLLLKTAVSKESSFSVMLKERIDEVFGKKTSEMGAFVELSSEAGRLYGWVGFPTLTRRNRTGQFLFVNGRLITSLLVSYAVKEGYSSSISSDRHPLFVLFLELPKHTLDVNVHPQKKEVRFRFEAQIKELCKRAALKAIDHPDSCFAPLLDDLTFPLQEVKEDSVSSLLFKEDLKEAFFLTPPPFPLQRSADLKKDEPFSFVYRQFEPVILALIPGYFFIDRPKEQDQEGVWIVNQKRLQERVFYEGFSNQPKEKLASQSLLIPLSLELSALQAASLKEHLNRFEGMGFVLREFGKNTVLIEAAPALFKIEEIQANFLHLLEELASSGEAGLFSTKRPNSWAFTKNVCLSKEEARQLVKEWQKLKSPLLSPKGEPIFKQISTEVCEKVF